MCKTLRNNRTNEVLNSKLTHEEAISRFLQAEGNNDNHWLWFWLHKVSSNYVPTTSGGTQSKQSGAIQFLCDSFVVAIGRGLKRPMIRLHFRNQRFKIYLSAKGTICIKTGMLADNAETGCKDPVGDEMYMGCLLRGSFLPATEWDSRTRQRGPERPLSETEQAFLEGISGNPVEFMAQCSRDMSRCCYCNLPLEDARSKEIGYGKVCAARYALPWGDKKHMEGAPNFAKLHGDTASRLCDAIRQNPQDETAWAMFSDWMKERGLPEVKMPEKSVTMPRNDSGGGEVRAIAAPVVERRTEEKSPWTLSEGTYVAEMSSLPKEKHCPKCNGILMSSQAKEERSYDEVSGWRFAHPCGAKLLIIND